VLATVLRMSVQREFDTPVVLGDLLRDPARRVAPPLSAPT
jgi:hypothetical protein